MPITHNEASEATAMALYEEAREERGLLKLAAAVGLSYEAIHDWTTRSNAPLWSLAALEKAWGIPALQRIVRRIAPRLHIALVGHEVTSRSLEGDVLSLGAEIGDVARQVEELGADGHYSALDCARIARECDDVESALGKARAKIAAMRKLAAASR